MVSANLLCRRMRMAIRGCTSSAANSEAQVPHAVRPDVPDLSGKAAGCEMPGEIPWLVRRAVTGGDQQARVVPGRSGLDSPRCLLLSLKLDRCDADRG